MKPGPDGINSESSLSEAVFMWQLVITKQITNRVRIRQISFDSPIAVDEGSELSLYDVVQKGEIPPPDTGLMEESVLANVDRALKKLREILKEKDSLFI